MASSSRYSSLTPLRSPSPAPPTQPDHFYGADDIQLPPSPRSDGKAWLSPEDDPLAHRGIPVFKPTMEEFRDFEGYVSKIECWGAKSGIVKVIPPKEWTDSLSPLKDQLSEVKIHSPIEQHMRGSGGRFRQDNMEKRKWMSVREWAELCSKDDLRAPGVGEVGLHGRSATVKPRTKRTKKTEFGPEVKQEPVDVPALTFAGSSTSQHTAAPSPPNSVATPSTPVSDETEDVKPSTKKRVGQTKEAREAALADRAAQDAKFLDTFDPRTDWLPPGTTAEDYTPKFCQTLERQYWRNCGLAKPPWYGADSAGTLFTEDDTVWNVGKLPSALSRLLPADNQSLPGVNTPYLYFGMWRATFAWHVEDMDLFSINYIHFGAPKFWYAIPQGRAGALEQTMRGYFPKDAKCSQFLRHKSYLVSPTNLAQSSCRPNFLVQHSGEFVITFPRGYHAGFNLGFNCAESVNFALESWIEIGKRAKACECVADSVKIDVNQLLADRAAEAGNPPPPPLPPSKTPATTTKRVSVKKENIVDDAVALKPKTKSKTKTTATAARKRKLDAHAPAPEGEPQAKKLKIKLVAAARPSQPGSSQAHAHPHAPAHKLTLRLPPKPAPPEPFPCCLCISMSQEGLLRVHDPPIGRKDAEEGAGNPKEWRAHEYCARIVPETWVDEVERDGGGVEKVVYGVDGVHRDRWHLKCSACTKTRPKAHGAPIQCTKGKCSKAFHVSCARDGAAFGIMYNVVREIEKDVILVGPPVPDAPPPVLVTPGSIDAVPMQVDGAAQHDQAAAGSGYEPKPQVVKTIKKFEIQVLCSQHNPIIAAAKKEAKQDKIKTELLALPEMARIKLRVSSGVFEVSLIKVIEATGSVEVLWDKGEKREFKWNCVIFGNTDMPVQQKPTEMDMKSEPSSGVPVQTYSSVRAATAAALRNTQYPHPHHAGAGGVAGSSRQAYGAVSGYYPPLPPASYDYWRNYSAQYAANPYAYAGYYPPPVNGAGAAAGAQYAAYGYQPQSQTQSSYHHPGYALPPPQPEQQQGQQQDQRSGDAQPPTQASPPQTQSYSASTSTSTSPPVTPEVQQALYSNLTALSSLQPDQFGDVLKNNSHLRDVAAMAAGPGDGQPVPSS
ncbi:hypothetical protein H0H92_006482 [Tricholoma furcatifolium]|nr:hypothetical protein H0H92_006482 [Tricholoma furcatifolium]